MSTSSFILNEKADPPCIVNLHDKLTKEQLLSFKAFKNWTTAIQASLKLQAHEDHTFHLEPYILRKIDVEAVTWFGEIGTKLGFAKINATISRTVNTEQGPKEDTLPGSIFLRGGSVGILMILQPNDVAKDSEDEKYALLTIQPRPAAGSLAFAEIPAGMLDDSGSFAGKAAEEIKEETSITVSADELQDMTKLATSQASTSLWAKQDNSKADPKTTKDVKETLQDAMYPSPGGCDEFMPLLLYQTRMPRNKLNELRGKATGLREEGEVITVKLVPLEDLWIEGSRDGKTLAALALYERLQKKGLLKKPTEDS